ncbi:EamA family transporter [Priestia koreensis]|uniref:EamA family transporter n=1 Tax=Priestia koreensis TaxID=284581 RepID=UPI003CFF92C8
MNLICSFFMCVNILTFILLGNKGLQLLQASSGGIFFFFQPLVGALLGWLLLHEQLGIGFIFGASLILASVMLVLKAEA